MDEKLFVVLYRKAHLTHGIPSAFTQSLEGVPPSGFMLAHSEMGDQINQQPLPVAPGHVPSNFGNQGQGV